MRNFLATFLAFPFLMACAASTVSDAQIKNIAVVSVIPDDARFTKLGGMVWENEAATFRLGKNISTVVEAIATKRIATTRPAWNIKTISYDSNALWQRMQSPGLVMATDLEKIQRELAELVRSNALDAIFVVSPGFTSNPRMTGLGVWYAGGRSSISVAYVHSLVSLTLHDSTGEVKAVARGIVDPRPIDPRNYAMSPSLKDNLRADLIARFSDDILNDLGKNLNTRFDQIGLSNASGAIAAGR